MSSWSHALEKLRRHGIDEDGFAAIRRWAMDHADAPRGVQLNGGCREGSCDKVPGSPKCRAWTLILALIAKLPDAE